MKSRAVRAKTAVGRADLLLVLAAYGEPALKQLAAALGYEREPPTVEVASSFASEASDTLSARIEVGPPPAQRIERAATLPAARFVAVTAREQAELGATATEEGPPEWFKRARALSEDSRPDPGTVRIPARLPLTRWSRLWPFLRGALSQRVPLRQPDVPRLIRAVSRGEALRTLPLRQRHDWSPRICMLLDYNRRCQPFRDDYNGLIRALARRHGAGGLDVRILHGEPGRVPHYRRPSEHAVQRWQMPGPGVPLLILSDLGMFEGAPATLGAWRQFGSRLSGAGIDATVLAPVPASRHAGSLQQRFSIFQWDRHSRLRPDHAPAATSADASEALLTLLAPAVLVEADLLRAMRYLLPASHADVGTEAAVWQHADVVSDLRGLHIASAAAVEKYQQRFRDLDPALQREVVRLIQTHHAGLPESMRLHETAVCERLAPGSIEPQALSAAKEWERNIVKTRYQRSERALIDWLDRFAARQSGETWSETPESAALWALAQREKLARGESVELPPGVRQEEVDFFLRRGESVATIHCTVRQRGQDLVLEQAEQSNVAEDVTAGSPVADFTLVDEGVFVWESTGEDTGGARWRFTAVGELPQPVARVDSQTEAIHIRSTRGDRLTLRPLTRPPWARAIGRDRQGLFAEAMWLDAPRRFYWQPPQADQAGRWAGGTPLGVDDCGLYADLEVRGVTQRFRWILPGTFLMGSPKTEPERGDDEVQHEVTLTAGFWLAETACTQALWQAVMGGKNPSAFQDDPRNPVEQVSWEDAQGFIDELNARVPGLEARLPTEAEWEYACRAGTTTPFSFGENVTPEQVNYDGNAPYAGGKKGLSRGRTVPVVSLPPNAWGLYEMHGNVWEWCADWYGGYPSEPQVDPRGPAEGANRVLRGGSWFILGRLCRSAYRRGGGPAGRLNDFGFRLARGQGASPGEGKAGGDRPAGQPRGTRGGQAGPGATSRKSRKRK
jgi:formylglycine-generating enzyme required for sulfatase activity